MIWKIALGLLALLVAGVAWRRHSVMRGAKARDRKLIARLDPLAERLERNEAVTADEIESLADAPELRQLLYVLLDHYGSLDLFPTRHLRPEAIAESALVYWMLHPNELQAAPSRIEALGAFERNVTGRTARYFAFRYRMDSNHWAGSDWIVGVAGPVFENDPPYGGSTSGFTRATDRFDTVNPEDLIDQYVELQARFHGPKP